MVDRQLLPRDSKWEWGRFWDRTMPWAGHRSGDPWPPSRETPPQLSVPKNRNRNR